MPTLSPKIASNFALASYDIQDKTPTAVFRIGGGLDQHFNFDLSKGPVQGVSGGFFAHLFNQKTGFALVGQGKGAFAGDIVIAIRGTAGLRDGITDGHFGLTGSCSGEMVHAGFYKTFLTMKSALRERIKSARGSSVGGSIHCVGHSLGGALAGIVADWLKSELGGTVNLYTFGSPRVGLSGFALKTTNNIDNIYRCTHGADPVPKVPLWPFTHAPYGGSEYRLDSASGFSPKAHSMGANGSPGYVNSANHNNWGVLQLQSERIFTNSVRLKYKDRHQATFGAYWSDRISAALITLLKDAGYYSAIVAQAGIGSAFTFYDLIARTLDKIVKISAQYADQTLGLLGHMLSFAGQSIYKFSELNYEIIKWVFDKTLGVLYRSVQRALESKP